MALFDRKPKKTTPTKSATATKKAVGNRLKTENANLRAKLKDIDEAHKAKLDQIAKEATKTKEAHAEALEKKDKAIVKLNTTIVETEDSVRELKKRVETKVELEGREIEVSARETKATIREKSIDAGEKERADLVKKADEAYQKGREEGHKQGYGDGVADGVREATKITAEDRKYMMQVALTAAASHNDDAATELAKATAQGIIEDARHALGAGTPSPEKSKAK